MANTGVSHRTMPPKQSAAPGRPPAHLGVGGVGQEGGVLVLANVYKDCPMRAVDRGRFASLILRQIPKLARRSYQTHSLVRCRAGSGASTSVLADPKIDRREIPIAQNGFDDNVLVLASIFLILPPRALPSSVLVALSAYAAVRCTQLAHLKESR